MTDTIIHTCSAFMCQSRSFEDGRCSLKKVHIGEDGRCREFFEKNYDTID